MDPSMIIDFLIETFIYPGLLFIIVMIIVTNWLIRKIGGRIQYRRGPTYTGPAGILQPFADFMKLLIKEDAVSKYSSRALPIIVAVFGVGALIALTIMTPIAYAPFTAPYDIIIFFYLALWASLAIMLMALATPNPYTSLGVGRYMALLVSSEPAFIASFLVPVIIESRISGASYSLYLAGIYSWQAWVYSPLSLIAVGVAAVAGFIAMMGILEIKPFDFPEAEGEIYWGVFTEYGGPRLAFAFMIMFIERIVIPMIYAILFLGGPWPIDIQANPLGGILVILAKYFIVYAFLAIIDNVMPRYRPDQAVRFLWKYAFTLSVIALIIAMGLVY